MNLIGNIALRLGSLLLLIMLTACQTITPEDGGTIGKIERVLAGSNKLEERKHADEAPPAAVVSALLPPVDLREPRRRRADAARFDVNVSQVPARAFFMGLVEGTDYNMVLHPSVAGTVTLRLKKVTIPEVMEVLRDVYGYEFQTTGSGYTVLPARLQSRIFQVNYLSMKRSGVSHTRVSSGQISETQNEESTDEATNESAVTSGTRIDTESEIDFWHELTAALNAIVGNEEGRAVVITPSSGIVIVRAMPMELRDVENYLQKIDVALHRQVVLEAKVIEVELNDGYQAGIDWAKVMRQGDNQLVIGQSDGGDIFGDSRVNLPSGGITDPQSLSTIDFVDFTAFGGLFGATLNTGSFVAFIELLQSQGNVQVLSSPRVATINNQKAVIKVGTDEFFVTDISSNENTESGNISNDIELTPFFSGIALDVTPQIDSSGWVTLHIHPSVSNVTDQQKELSIDNDTISLPLARSSVRESDSIVYARSGQLIVIGGLMQETTEENIAKTPFLGDLPVLGQLFRHTRQGALKSELVILLRPTVVAGSNTWSDDLSNTSDRFRRLNRGFHQGPRPDIFGNLGER